MNDAIPGPLAVVAHYHLLERLEPAGPGDLFRARDTRLGRTVAVRLLPAGFTDPDAREAFIADARGLTALSHPNVTTLFDVGEHDGRIYLAFEFLNGRSLRSEMSGHPINVRRALELTVQMADAVADAHACGYVHGGLSPESVVVTAKGHAKIPAYALASRGGFASSTGARLHDYDSPEEAQGLPSDERSDIYSVGAVLFEMLTGKRPLPRGSAAPSASNSRVPAEMDEVVLKAVAPNPESRYQSAAAFAAALRHTTTLLDERGILVDEPDGRPRSSSISGILIMSVVMILGIAAVVWWFWGA